MVFISLKFPHKDPPPALSTKLHVTSAEPPPSFTLYTPSVRVTGGLPRIFTRFFVYVKQHTCHHVLYTGCLVPWHVATRNVVLRYTPCHHGSPTCHGIYYTPRNMTGSLPSATTSHCTPRVVTRHDTRPGILHVKDQPTLPAHPPLTNLNRQKLWHSDPK